jgi:hypothetical protein
METKNRIEMFNIGDFRIFGCYMDSKLALGVARKCRR